MANRKEIETIEKILSSIVGKANLVVDEIEDYERFSIEVPGIEYKRLTPYVYSNNIYKFLMTALISVVTFARSKNIGNFTEEEFIDIVLDSYEKAVSNQENKELLSIVDKLVEDSKPALENLIKELGD